MRQPAPTRSAAPRESGPARLRPGPRARRNFSCTRDSWRSSKIEPGPIVETPELRRFLRGHFRAMWPISRWLLRGGHRRAGDRAGVLTVPCCEVAAPSPKSAAHPPETQRQGEAADMARQFIYHMQGLTKAFSGGKKVLENIHLSFYPDAKIGVLGPNGSGKSTLLRIMAGLDKEFTGEAWAARGRARRLPAAGAAARPVAGRARATSCSASRRSRRSSTATTS